MGFEGMARLNADMKGLIKEAQVAGQRVVSRSQTITQQAAMKAYTQAHQKGTPTPSAPGSPPAVITGALRRSYTRPTPTLLNMFTWKGEVYPTVIYARIQEKGGVTGRNHATVLPARPVLEPAVAKLQEQYKAIHVEEFGKVGV